jgi:signal peptidase II
VNRTVSRLILVAAVLLATIGVDRVTKLAAQSLKGRGTVPVVGSLLVLVYAENRGAFLSLGSGMPDALRPILLLFLPLAAMAAALVYLVLKLKSLSFATTFALAMFIGGGAGNLIDRFVHDGYVVDFMNFGIGSLRVTGILNFADLFLTAGVIMFVLTTGRKPSARNDTPAS